MVPNPCPFGRFAEALRSAASRTFALQLRTVFF